MSQQQIDRVTEAAKRAYNESLSSLSYNAWLERAKLVQGAFWGAAED